MGLLRIGPECPEAMLPRSILRQLFCFQVVVEAAFPECELIVSLIGAKADLVAARCTICGLHLGEFAGIGPTGKSVSSADDLLPHK